MFTNHSVEESRRAGQARPRHLGFGLARATFWLGVWNLLALSLFSQANPPTNLTVSSGTQPPYYAYSTITTSGSFTVGSGSSVLFQAPGTIRLEPGFHAVAGSFFHALLGAPPATVTQVITTAPVTGIPLKVDGANCSSPCTESWVPGYQHAVSAPGTYTVSGTQYSFSNWSDGGASTHTITAPSSAATYTADFQESSLPAVTLLSPGNGATVQSGTVTLGWTASSGATSYDVYLGASAPPPFYANTGNTSYTAGVTAGTTYYWKVVAKNGGGSSPASPVWSFTPAALPTLSINGGSSSAEVAPSTNVSMAFNLYDQAGANDIGWAQFYLADSSGNAYCYGDWGRPNGLDLYDGNTGTTWGFGINQSDSFCNISLASITNSPSDPTEVTVVLNFNFNPGSGGTYTVLTQVNYSSGYAGPWEAVGTLIIDPAREPVLSPPTDEPPPDPAPAPVAPPAVSASADACGDVNGNWVNAGDSRFSYSISTSGGEVTGGSSGTYSDSCGAVTFPISGFLQADGSWQLTTPYTTLPSCNVIFAGTATVVPGCASASVTGSGGGSSAETQGISPLATAATTTWSRTSNPPGITLTVDLMAGKITTQLSGMQKTSDLTIAVSSSSGQQMLSTSHASAQGGNSFNDAFRTRLPAGQYGSVVATWDTANVSVPVTFYVIGNTRLTQYNTPYEQNCHANPQTAYVINKIDKAADGYCYWKVVQLGSQFVTQVITNGTGVIGTNEIVKAYNAGARNVCDLPAGATTNNSFFSVDTGGNPITKIKGSHNTVLSDATGTVNSFNNNNPAAGSIAVLPNNPTRPTGPAFPFVFGDQLLLIDQNDLNDHLGPRSAEDYCPGCGPGSFSAPAVAHVDVYSSRQTCGTGSDYNNGAPFVTIRLR